MPDSKVVDLTALARAWEKLVVMETQLLAAGASPETMKALSRVRELVDRDRITPGATYVLGTSGDGGPRTYVAEPRDKPRGVISRISVLLDDAVQYDNVIAASDAADAIQKGAGINLHILAKS